MGSRCRRLVSDRPDQRGYSQRRKGSKTMTTKSNKRKNEFLGMPYGTACGKLRKMILFKFAKELGRDNCYRCGEKITDIRNFSIEHIRPWLGVDTKLFWDLDNIAFSHLSCNCKASSGGTKKIKPPKGQSWCWKCKQFKPIEEFPPKLRNKHSGSMQSCTACATAQRRKYARNR